MAEITELEAIMEEHEKEIEKLKNCMNCRFWDTEHMACGNDDVICQSSKFKKGRPVGDKWKSYEL